MVQSLRKHAETSTGHKEGCALRSELRRTKWLLSMTCEMGKSAPLRLAVKLDSNLEKTRMVADRRVPRHDIFMAARARSGLMLALCPSDSRLLSGSHNLLNSRSKDVELPFGSAVG
ncbi:hypothetical protein [Cupriavidus pinatubonensis]|uniref:hypothetical protein n=1 Tax=Cupriavidus pinatubonensis TaxID=248026 RepID=UPI001CC647C3|nr:hypothetical protein [Cupriavidus pinatubonensis]